MRGVNLGPDMHLGMGSGGFKRVGAEGEGIPVEVGGGTLQLSRRLQKSLAAAPHCRVTAKRRARAAAHFAGLPELVHAVPLQEGRRSCICMSCVCV